MHCKKEKKQVASTHRSYLNDDLVVASQYGNLHQVSQLLQVGASVRYWPTDLPFVDACHVSLGDPNNSVMEELIFQSLALYAACRHGHFQVVLTLFNHIKHNDDQMIDYWLVLLQTLRNRQNLLGEASDPVDLDIVHCVHNILFTRSANIKILKEFVKAGADLNIKCQCGMTPLVSAVSTDQCSMDVVNTLLQSGADPNIYCKDSISPLSMAAKHRNIKAMEALLKFGADGSLITCNGRHSAQAQHPIVYSVIYGDVSQVKLLLMHFNLQPITMLQFVVHAHHSFPFHVDDVTFFNKRISLLHLAFYCNRKEIVKLFLDINFLSASDIKSLPSDRSLYERLHSDEIYHKVLTIYEKIRSRPWSLFTMSFFVVSETVGFDAQRKIKLQNLGIPNPLIRKLLFLDH
ncbi:hypothetical protein Btru_012695 [Bulinus truncatus]|nr:hypothetical protein Btru_012695 [Bulinus truncatus]